MRKGGEDWVARCRMKLSVELNPIWNFGGSEESSTFCEARLSHESLMRRGNTSNIERAGILYLVPLNLPQRISTQMSSRDTLVVD